MHESAACPGLLASLPHCLIAGCNELRVVRRKLGTFSSQLNVKGLYHMDLVKIVQVHLDYRVDLLLRQTGALLTGKLLRNLRPLEHQGSHRFLDQSTC